MSYWYEPKKEDIDINGEDIDIFLTQDTGGSVYCSVKIKDIKELLEQNEKVNVPIIGEVKDEKVTYYEKK